MFGVLQQDLCSCLKGSLAKSVWGLVRDRPAFCAIPPYIHSKRQPEPAGEKYLHLMVLPQRKLGGGNGNLSLCGRAQLALSHRQCFCT